jgi:hypothetical protein
MTCYKHVPSSTFPIAGQPTKGRRGSYITIISPNEGGEDDYHDLEVPPSPVDKKPPTSIEDASHQVEVRNDISFKSTLNSIHFDVSCLLEKLVFIRIPPFQTNVT